MINIFDILSSINIISGIILGIIIIVILYELKSIKEHRSINKSISVPDFDKKQLYAKVESTDIAHIVQAHKKKPDYRRKQKIIIILGCILLIVLFLFTVNIFLFKNTDDNNKKEVNENKLTILKSTGIHLYNKEWQELKEDDILIIIQKKEPLYIGIETVSNNLIDKARIRINESFWAEKHETTQFNKDLKMYYTNYISSSESASLVIEAQLYSKEDGWLGN